MMKRSCLFWVSVFLTFSIGCLLLSIAILMLLPAEWLPQFGANADDEGDAPLPVVITTDPVIAVSPVFTPAAESVGTPLPTPTELPAPTPIPAPTVTQAQVNFVADIMKPLAAEAARRRRAAQDANPAGFATRIDAPFNANRLNFLVTGYGVTYEPPYPPTYKGHVTLYSLDLNTLQISTVTLNHDIRAPEVERYMMRDGKKVGPSKLDRAHLAGGFPLARTTVEDATGLNVDFQLVFQDLVVKNIVDEVFGGLLVDVPYVFDAAPIVFADKQYPALRYAQGKQKLNGLQTLQFIKAINAQLGKTKYDPRKEPAVRKQIVVTAVLDNIKRETTNPVFWARLANFLRRTLDNKEVEYDFDAASLLFQTINQYVARGAQGEKIPLTITRSLFVVDQAIGDGGVQWVGTSANPIMVRDIKNGVYPELSISVPTGKADPYAPDLAANYWTSVRQLVKKRISP
ncbi:MAG: LCP family protein [Chloroflexi bacterium]|nr:LCP family protein [Chloroflexota bacterium]